MIQTYLHSFVIQGETWGIVNSKLGATLKENMPIVGIEAMSQSEVMLRDPNGNAPFRECTLTLIVRKEVK